MFWKRPKVISASDTLSRRMHNRQEFGRDRHQAWNEVNFKRVRQQHLANLEALLREALRSGRKSTVVDAALPTMAAALLSTVDDASVVEAGVSGLPNRATRAALALDAAALAFADDQDQVAKICRLAVEFAATSASRESCRLDVIRHDIKQGHRERAYDLLTAPRRQQFDRPDSYTRALLAGQLKHGHETSLGTATWVRSSQHCAG